jgi:hypothetical protein
VKRSQQSSVRIAPGVVKALHALGKHLRANAARKPFVLATYLRQRRLRAPTLLADAMVVPILKSRSQSSAHYVVRGSHLSTDGPASPQDIRHDCEKGGVEGHFVPLHTDIPVEPGDTIVCRTCVPARDFDGQPIRFGGRIQWLCDYYLYLA